MQSRMFEKDNEEWTDLSVDIYPEMDKMEFLPCPSIERLSEQGDTSLQVSEISFATHIGTHCDAAAHAITNGDTVEEYPLDRWIGTAAIIHVDVEPKSAIDTKDVSTAEDRFDEVDAIIVHTGWEDKLGTTEFYDHPYFTDELAKWFVEQDIEWVGMDFLTPDMPPDLRPDEFTYPVHTTLLGNDILIVENLTNISTLSADVVEVAALPIKLRNADGAPMRVAARPLSK